MKTTEAIEQLILEILPKHKSLLTCASLGLDNLIKTYEKDIDISLRLHRCQAKINAMLINLMPDQTSKIGKASMIEPIDCQYITTKRTRSISVKRQISLVDNELEYLWESHIWLNTEEFDLTLWPGLPED